MAVGGCLGPAGIGLQATGLTIAAAGLAALILWIALCRDCMLMRFLQRFFGAMALTLAAISAVLALMGLFTCSAGAAAVAVLFAAIVGVLSAGIAILKCP